MIEFRSVAKHYGLRTLFQGLSFSLRQGELVAFTGPSGIGKSTLIHMLFGAQTPDEGMVLIDGHNIPTLGRSELQLLRRSMGVIFQDFKLLPKKTVFENVAFAMEACGESDDDIEIEVPKMLHRVHLSGFEHKFPYQLSGGERQRVAIARALIHKPSLLLADEPTGNLDPVNAREVGAILKKLHEEEQMTIVIATHDRELVELLKPRVLFFDKGHLERDEVDGQFWKAGS